MNLNILKKKLQAGETIYLLDDFNGIAVRLMLENGSTKSYIKHQGHSELEVPQSNETVCDIILGGKEISKFKYERYK